MKKTIIILLFIFLLTLTLRTNAKSYSHFSSIEFDNKDLKLVEYWTESEIQEQLKKIKGKRMFGWKTIFTCKSEEFTFVANTLLSVENKGESPINEVFEYNSVIKEKVQLGVTGDLGVDLSKTGKNKFKYGLDAKIKVSYSTSSESTITEKLKSTISVDPNTRLTVKVVGKGKIYQGVAKQFIFFAVSRSGAFETVIITDEYYSIEKVAITQVIDLTKNRVVMIDENGWIILERIDEEE